MAARTTGDEEGQLVSSDTLQTSGIEPVADLGGLAEPPVVCAVKTVLANDGGPAPEPPPRAAAEAPPARASTAFRVPPPVDAFLERQMQQQLAQLAAAEPPEPDERRKGFVLFQAMPGGLFSAIVHMLVFLVLSVYVANDPTGARSVSLQVVDAEQDDTDVDEFVEMVVEEPADAEEETLEVAPDQAFLDNVMLDPPEIAHPEVVLPELDEVAREFHDRLLVVRVTDSAEGWLAARYHLSFVPTLVFFRGGSEQCRIKGDPGKAAIRAHLQFLLTGECPPDPAEGPRHTLAATFGQPAGTSEPRALLT